MAYTAQAKRLAHQLSDARRELDLSRQIVDQLDRINTTHATIHAINKRFIYDIADLDDRQLEDLKHRESDATVELKAADKRLRMLRQIETNGCSLGLKLLPYKRTGSSQSLMIGDKQVFIERDIDYDVLGEETEEEEDDEKDGTEVADTYSQRSAPDSSVVSYDDTDNDSFARGMSGKQSDRKRAIPERFESFPSSSAKKSSRVNASNGVKAIIYFMVSAFVLFFISFYINN